MLTTIPIKMRTSWPEFPPLSILLRKRKARLISPSISSENNMMYRVFMIYK